MKIGISVDVDKRLRTLQTGNPDELEIVASVGPFSKPGEARKWEKWLHRALEDRHIRDEWFWIRPDEVEDILGEMGWV